MPKFISDKQVEFKVSETLLVSKLSGAFSKHELIEKGFSDDECATISKLYHFGLTVHNKLKKS